MDDDLLAVIGEADTVCQAVAELLSEYAQDDEWASDILAQVRALGENARELLHRHYTR